MPVDILSWLTKAAADQRFGWHCRGLDLRLDLIDGHEIHSLLLCESPQLVPVDTPAKSVISVKFPAVALSSILSDVPPPGYHSYGAWKRHDTGVQIAANALDEAQALAALERLAELGRPSEVIFTGFPFEHDAEAIKGHRRYLENSTGQHCLIHWIEAGNGSPILFLHTAGADSRQYIHQIADRALQDGNRLVAFDMPWHGLSEGEDAVPSTAGYELTEASYLDWCVTFIEKVLGEPVVIIGCSVGAAMALTLTAHRPDLVRGCIALEAPMTAPGRRSPMLTDARIADSQHNPAYVRAMLSPTAPQRFRDEAAAIYAQARPGVYMGDLTYYSIEYDGARIAPALRECERPIVLLTGSYDYSASPENTRQLVETIDSQNVEFHEMPQLGHFPMIEDPVAFRPFLLMALKKLGNLQ